MRQARAQQQRIFALAFHVDYWNYLGWADPFSDRQYADRQRLYARRTRSFQVYTPQMIVNGTRQLVGSDRTAGTRAIEAALAQPAEVGIGLSARPAVASDRLTVVCEVAGVSAPSLLHVTLVERGIVRDIGAGENAGARLQHENVVRTFTSVELQEAGTYTIELALPHDLVRSQASVIGYVQQAHSMQILGAAGIDVP